MFLFSYDQRSCTYHTNSGNSFLQVVGLRRGASFSAGDNIRLESALNAASLLKRQRAVETLVKGHGVISNLPDFFTTETMIEPTVYSAEPTDKELDFYTEQNDDGEILFSLNDDQRQAFKNLYTLGPIGLLQGPPGTGKTAFISSFIHYAVERGTQRILLVSQSHEAVNNAAEKVKSLFQKNQHDIGIVRLGNEGQVSESLLDVHELAIQDHYREKFRAEYKTRINSVAEPLGLTNDFVSDLVDFEYSFGITLDLLLSLSKIEMDNDFLKKFNDKLRRFTDKFHSYTEHKGLSSFSIEKNSLSSLRKTYHHTLALHHNIYSEDAIERIKQIVLLANEWLKVMSSSKANFQNFLVKTRTLICGTCVGIGRAHYGIQENIYDWVIIDEAARSSASEMAIAMQVGRRVLLVGDHKQLPPMFEDTHLKAAQRKLPKISIKELKRSDFEKSFLSPYGKLAGQTLLSQYRMSKPIGDLVSNCFYNGMLKTCRGNEKPYMELLPSNLGTTVTWVDTSDAKQNAYESKLSGKQINGTSFVNEYEIKTIISLVSHLTQKPDFISAMLADSIEPPIGIICMYSEQKRQMIRQFNSIPSIRILIENGTVKIDTVDSYQGKENKIIIVSLVRNNNALNEGFLTSEQRINVALSRAQERLYIIGASAMWANANHDSPVGSIYSYIKARLGEKHTIINSIPLKGEL